MPFHSSISNKSILSKMSNLLLICLSILSIYRVQSDNGLFFFCRQFQQSVRTASSVSRGGFGVSGKMFFVTGAKSAGGASSGGGATRYSVTLKITPM